MGYNTEALLLQQLQTPASVTNLDKTYTDKTCGNRDRPKIGAVATQKLNQ